MRGLTITDCLSQAELLAMLAEEAAELSQAALKLRRVLDGNNPTPMTYGEAKQSLIEEAADVELCMRQVHALDNRHDIELIKANKYNRWMERLMAENGLLDGRLAIHEPYPIRKPLPAETDGQ